MVFAPPAVWRAGRFLLAPFCAGFALSYVFRNVNGAISQDLIHDMGMDAATLGLITGSYFLAFTLSQLPVGIALDRFGPRRVHSALLLVAGAGALYFSIAQDASGLIIGRLLIGIGTAGCLMSGLKAASLWFPRDALPGITGAIIMCGGFGTMTATTPLVIFVDSSGWRAAFVVLAGAALALAVLTWRYVPDPAKVAASSAADFKQVVRRRWFWQLALVSALSFGAVAAFQGLWAARWFSDVDHLDPHAASIRLLVMASAFIAGAPAFGYVSRLLQGRVSGALQLIVSATTLVVLEILILLQAPIPNVLAWAALALFGAVHVLTFGILATAVPKPLIGRANSTLNLTHIGTAFVLQLLFGTVVNQWPRLDGCYPPLAYWSAMTVVIVLQLGAIMCFVLFRPAIPRMDQKAPVRPKAKAHTPSLSARSLKSSA